LSAAQARAIGPFVVRGPAREGDVFRAIADRPRAIVLIDGVFEASPSVWHHELRAALDAGIAVFGAASMGALRAAELRPFGMVGVGKIFEAFRSGALLDDAEVALRHGEASSGFRPLTVPLVNVRFSAAQAVASKALTRSQAAALVDTAAALFFQERAWPHLLRVLTRRRGAALADAVSRAFPKGPLDLKALDARAALARAARHRAQPERPVVTQASALVRRRWVGEGEADLEARAVTVVGALAQAYGVAAPASTAGSGHPTLALRAAQTRAFAQAALASPERFAPDGPSTAEASLLRRR
jgi:hypothetical protein